MRQPDGRYRVQDSKLARHARVTALLQLAAYAEQLDRLGIPCDPEVELLLGDGTTSRHHRDDITPVYLNRVARLREIIDDRVADTGPVAWGDPRYHHDGRCPTCELEVQAHRDVLMVGGLRVTQREHLAAAGITTIDELAASVDPVPYVLDATLDGLREQARLQLQAEAAQLAAEAAGTRSPDDPPLPPPVSVREARALAAIPEPSRGDLFFDFEGDPLYTEGDGTRWNLDYLWGMVDTDEHYTAFWAHSFAEEREALVRFLEFVKLRRAAHPDLHIYHYASYERTHLTSIAARHGVGESDVDQLLADGVLVDLYPIVKRAVRVGSRSYSIKKLEPLYMGDAEQRQADVKSGGDSITEYVRARDLIDSGHPGAAIEAQEILDDLADYNEYDCLSTLRLRDWLLALARREGVPSVPMQALIELRRWQGLRALTARRAPARTRRSRRPRARRRSHRTRARRGRHRLPRARGEELLVEPLPAHRPARRGLARPPRRARGRSARLSRDAGVAQRAAVEQRPSRDPAHRRHRTRLQVLARQRGVPALRVAGALPLAFAAPGPARHDRRGHPRGHRGRRRGRRAGRRRRDVVGAAHGDHPRSTSEHQRPARRDRRVGSADPRRPAAAAAQPRHGRAAPAPATRYGRARAAPARRRVRR